MRHLATLAVLFAACTTHNPSFVGNADLNPPSGDLAGPADLSGPMGTCGPGERKCPAPTASDRCENGTFIVDRECPAGSVCSLTYCAPPVSMLPTQIGQRCDAGNGAQDLQCSASKMLMLTCQPFVNPANKSVQWFCDTPVGAGAAGTACTRASQCRSGICGANGTCFAACQQDFECKNGLHCNGVDILVEGVRVQAGSCVP
jgi:hypothetical protein